MSRLVFCLMGPTASNKTRLACELTNLFPFEIISVDSAMIYREMDIGTAKPTLAERKKYPHHLVDILDPPETYSASAFCDQTDFLIKDIFSRGKFPLLVGGTMMYFKAFQQGLSVLPESNQAIREKILKEAELLGWQKLHDKLREVDSNSAERIHPNDTQRIQRALEVYYLTSQPFSNFYALGRKKKEYEFVNLILFPGLRQNLHDRIAVRFKQMLQDGFIEEVAYLKEKWNLKSENPSMRSVGYRQVFDYIEGKYDLVALKEKGIAATRQLAKRQLTWLRKWENPILFDSELLDKIAQQLIDTIEIFFE